MKKMLAYVGGLIETVLKNTSCTHKEGSNDDVVDSFAIVIMLDQKGRVDLKYNSPAREQCTFGTMTGCTGGWTLNHPFCGLDLCGWSFRDRNVGDSTKKKLGR